MHFYLVIPELAKSKCIAFANGATREFKLSNDWIPACAGMTPYRD